MGSLMAVTVERGLTRPLAGARSRKRPLLSRFTERPALCSLCWWQRHLPETIRGLILEHNLLNQDLPLVPLNDELTVIQSFCFENRPSLNFISLSLNSFQ